MTMRVVVVGATGNVGTSLLKALGSERGVDSVLGLARRRPSISMPKVTWGVADVTSTDFVDHFRGADVVVHLTWAIQPSHDINLMERINVEGSGRVFRAVAEAGVPSLVYASSVGAYSPGPKDRPVDESWPTGGVRSSFYSRHKAAVERLLDDFEVANPGIRVVRLRKALIFKGEAAWGIRKLFLGRLIPGSLLRPSRIPIVPKHPRFAFQAVHTDDVADAYRLAVLSDAKGPFNIAADPVLDAESMATALRARQLPVPAPVLQAAADLSWRLRLQPSPKGWVDLALQSPILDSSRARRELGWSPSVAATDALIELLEGFADGANFPTPPLEAPASASGRRPDAQDLVTPRQTAA